MSLSRRFFLAAGASAAGASLYGCSGLALTSSAPVVSTLAPGVARVRFGNATITSLPDGFVDRPLVEGFVRNATLPQVQAALKDAGLPTDKVTVPFTPFLVQVGGRNVIFDGGNGTFGAPTSGRMLDSLKATGLPMSDSGLASAVSVASATDTARFSPRFSIFTASSASVAAGR